MKRMGRPKKAVSERKSHVVALRLTTGEYEKLTAKAKALTVTEYIRKKLGLRSDA